MSDWRSWRLQEWNEHLLRHFFGRRAEDDPPVVALLATPEELARATGDASADATEVRDAFVSKVVETVGKHSSLLDHASNYQGWPGLPASDRAPRFVSHLFFTCIAAAESSEELGSEGSYLQRLRELAGGTLPDHTLQWLPALWANFAGWLVENARFFRPLKLPDPGGYTRIGHSVKLTFPDRRDQRILSELLDRAGLQGHEPPVGKVIGLVAGARGRFRPAFQEAFDDFRSGSSSGARPARDTLEHRFWSAVRDAALRGRGASAVVDGEGVWRFQLLCEEQEDRLHPFLVTDEAMAGGQLRTVELPVAFDVWRHAVVRSETERAGAEAAYATARDVLLGRIAIPRLRSFVVQGLLPLVDGVHGCLEFAGQEQLEQSRTALAREDRAKDLIDLFGKGRARSNASVLPGWMELRGLHLGRLPADKLERTALAGCWQLYESIVGPTVRLQEGVKADDGWLGFREILPRLAVSGAREVLMYGADGGCEALRADGEGIWCLPSRDLEGTCRFEVRLDAGGPEHLSARFNRTVGTERVRMPEELDSWILEGLGGTVTLAGSAPLAGIPTGLAAPVAECTYYLGPVVGEFVAGPDDAAWRITRFAGRTTGARCRHDLAEASGAARVAGNSARRKWRQLLFHCRADPSDAGFVAARSRIRQRALSPELPISGEHVASVTMEMPQDIAVGPEVERQLGIAAARAGGRTGIPYREWAGYVERVMGVSREQTRALTRSWTEAGILDVAYFARWRHCSVFMRPPCVVAFGTEHGYGATILGMLLPATRSSVQAAARQAGVEIEERSRVTAKAPSLVTMRCGRREQLESLSARAGLTLGWLDPVIERYAEQCRHDGRGTPPQNYDERKSWSRWSLGLGLDATDVSFTHCVCSGRPDYWHVTAGERSVWSYDLNTARLWGLALLQQSPFALTEGGGLTAEHAFLPLPLARFLTIVEGTAPGSDAGGRYRYPCGSPTLRERVLNVVASVFDPQRLPARAPAILG